MANKIFKIDISEAFVYLKNRLIGRYIEKDIELLKYIVLNIAMSVLDNDKLSGSNAECFNDAVDCLTQLNLGQDHSYQVCSELTDLIISYIVEHIPDYDHAKYEDSLNYTIEEDLNVRIELAQRVFIRSVGL